MGRHGKTNIWSELNWTGQIDGGLETCVQDLGTPAGCCSAHGGIGRGELGMCSVTLWVSNHHGQQTNPDHFDTRTCLCGTCDVDLWQPLWLQSRNWVLQHRTNINITDHSQKLPFCMAWRMVCCLKLNMKGCCFKGCLLSKRTGESCAHVRDIGVYCQMQRISVRFHQRS
jgi:hypothetical protein